MSRRLEISEVIAALSRSTRCYFPWSSSWDHCSSCFLSSWCQCGHICMIITVDQRLSRHFHSCRWFYRCRSIVRIQIITIHCFDLSLHSIVNLFDSSNEFNECSSLGVLHSIDRISLQVSVIMYSIIPNPLTTFISTVILSSTITVPSFNSTCHFEFTFSEYLCLLFVIFSNSPHFYAHILPSVIRIILLVHFQSIPPDSPFPTHHNFPMIFRMKGIDTILSDEEGRNLWKWKQFVHFNEYLTFCFRPTACFFSVFIDNLECFHFHFALIPFIHNSTTHFRGETSL